MSTRDREPDQGPLRYAPKWARKVGAPEAARRNRPRRPSAEPVPLRAVEPQSGESPSPQSPSPQSPPSPTPLTPPPAPSSLSPPLRPREPPRQARKPRGAFEGDIAIRELRERMALAPDLPPSPPLRPDGAALGIVLRLSGLVALAAIAAYGFVWISTPRSPGGGPCLAGGADHRRRQSARSAIGERGARRHDPGGVHAAGFTVHR